MPKLLDKKIESAVIFTKISEEYRGNITLNEVKKIIQLSNTLENYIPKGEWVSEEKDNMGRTIIKNKYRVLDYAWKESKLN